MNDGNIKTQPPLMTKTKSIILYKLKDIASWQLTSENASVELPALQRSFVWKVNQIEALWDSILRGYPVGAFLISKTEDEKFFLLDGQQRTTSLAIGYYNPWHNNEADNNEIGSLKKHIPIAWIDLHPNTKPISQKFVVKIITQSHPWGYQRMDSNSVLSISDRSAALDIFRQNPSNKGIPYIQLSLLNVFPYDADLPVPLSFLLKAIEENGSNWKTALIKMCASYLPINYIKTKHTDYNKVGYLELLKETLENINLGAKIFDAISNLADVEIPGIIVRSEILKAEEDPAVDDPTLFVRLNSYGTRIAGDELIYSIYKASFPEAKHLVESIGASFIAPAMVISLASRLILSDINQLNYPYPISVNDFRKKIQDEDFKNPLRLFIGDKSNSPAKELFVQAFDLLLSEDEIKIPPVLVKSIVKNSPELLLMLLQWLKINKEPATNENNRRMLALITALSFFCKNNLVYVRNIWKNINQNDFLTKHVIKIAFRKDSEFIMYPLISPEMLRDYLLKAVVENGEEWGVLYPNQESEIAKFYINNIDHDLQTPAGAESIFKNIWDSFTSKVTKDKSLVLFAQKEYINDNFREFNQMETLEDTNSPWDWDHIYPQSWVYYQQGINKNTRHWTNTIGNLRALPLEENRSERNQYSPMERLLGKEKLSFINENDWQYWQKIMGPVKEGDEQMIKNHLSAIITRLYNIYNVWYTTLQVGELFNYEENSK